MAIDPEVPVPDATQHSSLERTVPVVSNPTVPIFVAPVIDVPVTLDASDGTAVSRPWRKKTRSVPDEVNDVVL